MLALDSPLWSDLDDCYGSAEYVPDRLRRIESTKRLGKQFWDDFANRLCHQCMVKSASIATFPHLVRIADARHKDSTGFTSLSIAAMILSYTLGTENKLPKIDKVLAIPFKDAISNGQNVVRKMLYAKRRNFSQSIEFLSIIAAFDRQIEASLLIEGFGGGSIDCPECGKNIPMSRLYVI